MNTWRNIPQRKTSHQLQRSTLDASDPLVQQRRDSVMEMSAGAQEQMQVKTLPCKEEATCEHDPEPLLSPAGHGPFN